MSFSLSEAVVSFLTLTEHTLGSCRQLSSLQKHTWGIPRLLFMGSFDKHPVRYGGQGHKEIVMDSQACGLNCSQSHECNSPTTSCDAMDYWTYQSQTTSVPLVPWDSRLKNPNCLKLSQNWQSKHWEQPVLLPAPTPSTWRDSKAHTACSWHTRVTCPGMGLGSHWLSGECFE